MSAVKRSLINDQRSEELAKVDLWVIGCIAKDTFKGNGTSIAEKDHESTLLENLLKVCPAEPYWTSKQKLKVAMIFLGEFLGLAGAAGGALYCVDRAARASEADAKNWHVENQPLVGALEGEQDPARPDGRGRPSKLRSTSAEPSSDARPGQAGRVVPKEGAEDVRQPPVDADPGAIELGPVQGGSDSSSSLEDDDGNDEASRMKRNRLLAAARAGKRAMR